MPFAGYIQDTLSAKPKLSFSFLYEIYGFNIRPHLSIQCPAKIKVTQSTIHNSTFHNTLFRIILQFKYMKCTLTKVSKHVDVRETRHPSTHQVYLLHL